VTFLWHFHQPSYWDPIRQVESMPWVRLHSMKGYSDMADALEKHPEIKANVNLVPSLLDRWDDLTSSQFRDEYYCTACTPATELKPEDKEFLISRFFQANWDTMIHPYPRYHQLLVKRGHRLTPARLSKAVKDFTVADFRDLQVWFDLSWFGYSALERFKELRELRRRDRGFKEDDKQIIWKIQKQLISELIPRYRRLWEQGQVEITTSPYYHPILPLLIDNEVARRGLPKGPLPSSRFQAPEDARIQLDRAAGRVEELFGRKPIGLWPSEGSVSMEAMQLAAECGFRWAASDEAILYQTLGQSRSGKGLYQPFLLDVDPPITLLFRDHGLSDAIGFRYSRIPAKSAAEEFIGHLEGIDGSFGKKDRTPLVSVILDGENAWEYFGDSGNKFLSKLYHGLESHASIKTVCVGEYLAGNPPTERLTSLFPGSWINGNFRVWIGDKEKNRAWDLLTKTRQVLVEAETTAAIAPERRSSAWEALYRAEGSDWFWWYGDIYSSNNDAEFDRLFRNNLRDVYRQLNTEVPSAIERPIAKVPGEECRIQPAFTMTPVLDGRVTSYYEWIGACKFDVCRAGGTMSLPDARAQQIYYGFDVDFLYLRVDFRRGKKLDYTAVKFLFNGAPNVRLTVQLAEKGQGILDVKADGDIWQTKGACGEFAWEDILEVKMPFDSLGARTGEDLGLYLLVMQEDTVLERWPLDGVIQFQVPSLEDISVNWCV
jgi:alpha-amylase/alpha-mannosidase (GH57 family)